jgi:CRISPR-associated protein (TIGR03984 family)
MTGDTTKIVEAALKGFTQQHGAATVLAYTPKTCRILRLKGGPQGGVNLDYGPDGQNGFSLDDVFELRAFNAKAELRWLKEGGGGRTVILTDESLTNGHLRPLGRTAYLLWGTVSTNDDIAFLADGLWLRVFDPRVGGIWLPISRPTGFQIKNKLKSQPDTWRMPKSLRLIVQEYATVGPHGNVTVAEERLLRIGIYNGEGPRS